MSDLHCPARVYVARHGEAKYDAETLSDSGGTLTALGRKQARDLADSLREERIARIWTSPLSRAVQTAEIVAARLGVDDVVVHEKLHEFYVGDWDGRQFERELFDGVYAEWAAGRADVRIPGAESGAELAARMREALDEIADQHRGEAVLVVTHGGVMLTALPPLSRLPYPAGAPTLANCGSLEAGASGWRAISWCGEPCDGPTV